MFSVIQPLSLTHWTDPFGALSIKEFLICFLGKINIGDNNCPDAFAQHIKVIILPLSPIVAAETVCFPFLAITDTGLWTFCIPVSEILFSRYLKYLLTSSLFIPWARKIDSASGFLMVKVLCLDTNDVAQSAPADLLDSLIGVKILFFLQY